MEKDTVMFFPGILLYKTNYRKIEAQQNLKL